MSEWMYGCTDGRMQEWKDGRIERWKAGRIEGWKDGSIERWKHRRKEVMMDECMFFKHSRTTRGNKEDFMKKSERIKVYSTNRYSKVYQSQSKYTSG